ncbi:MAG: C39 family peptidase [Chloroflexi bacterium]|nr:C39 family peptidase [Chloroflexota bacterium]
MWLKPNSEDKNVSPWQMVEYVNQHTAGDVRALLRYGGTLDRLKTLVANNFPVLIESGYDPVSANQGWMGHYLLVTGYDDGRSHFITQDSYDGPDLAYSYEHIREYWKHFNYLYIALSEPAREAELMSLLGRTPTRRTTCTTRWRWRRPTRSPTGTIRSPGSISAAATRTWACTRKRRRRSISRAIRRMGCPGACCGTSSRRMKRTWRWDVPTT